MCRIGVFFRAAFNDAKEDALNQTVIGWNSNNLKHEQLLNLLQERKKSSGGKGGSQKSNRKKVRIVKSSDEYTRSSTSDEKAAAEMKRLAQAISRGFQPG